jgi:hypothetical protein
MPIHPSVGRKDPTDFIPDTKDPARRITERSGVEIPPCGGTVECTDQSSGTLVVVFSRNKRRPLVLK